MVRAMRCNDGEGYLRSKRKLKDHSVSSERAAMCLRSKLDVPTIAESLNLIDEALKLHSESAPHKALASLETSDREKKCFPVSTASKSGILTVLMLALLRSLLAPVFWNNLPSFLDA
ncbi:hypothetical protein NDU88_004495 [Pleurodeles waltl]|uniref:Uncharacterized protein n=1 Tax=Pleurodeles waltl TaxID=8319 RepID=A0AAV7TSQ7_PLEWA|nr:hypothetical protein NDU88_004495 [Pleurodeles waltl]